VSGAPITRRAWLREAGAAAAALALVGPARLGASPAHVVGGEPSPEDARRLRAWVAAVRAAAGSDATLADAAIVAGEQALGTPYEAFTLEAYLRAGGDPGGPEPLALSLTRFDCVTLVESCLAIARLARAAAEPTWGAFGREVARLRYRDGVHAGYAARLHYFSEWIADNARRGGLRDIGPELGATEDRRPLRFMGDNPDSYPALAVPAVRAAIRARERALDGVPRNLIPTGRIPAVQHRIRSGDVLAFATAIDGLDVSHAAFAYRSADGVLRVLHAPLSGGVVEVTRADLPGYVAGLRRATGILVARPQS
jgi:hypothetical protein